jgi:ABC-type multidrug transport system ATPase subunit
MKWALATSSWDRRRRHSPVERPRESNFPGNSPKGTGNTFFILDEPTTGLHFADVEKLLHVLFELVERGNTVVVIEHNLDVIKCADHIIDLGPEGGDKGGRVIVTGTPEEIMNVSESYTGLFLRKYLNGDILTNRSKFKVPKQKVR